MDFTWKGQTASGMGLCVTALPPIQAATRRDEAHTVPHRSGKLHIQDGSLDELIKPVQCYLPYEQGAAVAPLRAIMAWLQGRGRVSFSDDPGREYEARIISQIDFGQWVTGYEDREFAVFFECEPWAYHTQNIGDITLTASGQQITNPGRAEAAPLLAVTGSGDAALMVGAEILTLSGLDGTIYLDCDIEEAYAVEGGIPVSRNEKMSGEFPRIPPGLSAVSWTGGVTQVVVTPRWRD